MENTIEGPRKIKNRSTKWFSKSANSRRYPRPHVHFKTFTTVKTWKQPKYSMIGIKNPYCWWIKKMNELIKKKKCVSVYHTHTHTHTDTYTCMYTFFSHQHLPFETIWMELTSVMRSEISQRKIKWTKGMKGIKEVQTFNYKISARDLRYSTTIVTSLQYCTVYLKIL